MSGEEKGVNDLMTGRGWGWLTSGKERRNGSEISLDKETLIIEKEGWGVWLAEVMNLIKKIFFVEDFGVKCNGQISIQDKTSF